MKNFPRQLLNVFLFSSAALILPLFTHTAFATGPTITTTSLPDGITNTSYSETVDLTGGTGPFTWNIVSGSLPSGFSLDTSSGQISGYTYPGLSDGINNFTIQVEDANSDSDTQDLSIFIDPLLTITTNMLPDATIERPYSQYIEINGGTAPFDFSISNGGLTDGLSLNSSTGEISGAPTNLAISFIDIQVTDARGQSSPAQHLTIIVNSPPSLTIDSLNNATVNTLFTPYLYPTGGTAPLSFSIASGSLPNGLSLATNPGNIWGRPLEVGLFNFIVEVTDANGASSSQAYTLTVDYAPPVISNTLTNATVSRPYSKALGLNGGIAPFTWSILTGSLPSGFSLASASGLISGSPTTVGSSSFVVQVQDSNSTIATRSLTLTIKPTPSITTTSLPDGAVNTPYSQSLEVTGGATPFSWTVTTGSLPNGLSLANDLISGRPTEIGSTSFTVQATDANGATTTQSLSLATNYASLAIVTTSLPSTIANGATYYSQIIDTVGGTGPFYWTVTSGSLPYGISLHEYTGELSGYTYPDVYGDEGIHHFTVQVADANSESDTQDLVLTIYGHPNIVTTDLPDATEGADYSHSLEASDGLAPYTWSVIGIQLPYGLSLNSSTGEVTGTTYELGSTDAYIRVTDANGQFETEYIGITVNPAPRVTTIKLDDATSGGDYSETVESSDGTTPMTWSIASGSLPSGLSLNSSTGTISGTPDTPGSSIFIIQAQDANLAEASQEFAIIVHGPLVIERSGLPHGKTAKTYSQYFPIAGGVRAFAWTVSDGSLPSGLSLNSSTGILSGTLSSPGTSTFTIQVEDTNGATITKSFELVVD